MDRKITIYVCFALILASLFVLTPSPVGATITGDTPPADGDWNVYNDTVVVNETIVLSGNLTVHDGANLTFKNVTLLMNCTASAQWKIDVRNGSIFTILDLDGDNTTTDDASVITAVDPTYNFLFLVREQAEFEMRNSELHETGGGYIAWQWDPLAPTSAWRGLCILSDNATVDHNNISYNRYGVVMHNSDAVVSNNTIYWNDVGARATWWSNGTIENNRITWSDTYGIEIDGWDNTPGYPSNPKVTSNLITDTGRGAGPGNGNGIHITYRCKPLIKDTRILRTGEDGLYSSDGSTPTLINVTIDGANYGIASSATRYIYILNSTITNTILYDLSIQGAPGSFFMLTNSTFNESKIIIDSSGNLTVRWYLHVKVQDSLSTPIEGADVRIRDNENGTFDENFTTNLEGYVRWIVLTEYWQNSTTRINYTPHNLNVTYSGLTFINNPRDSTMDQFKTEVFTATTPVPEFPSIVFLVTIILAVVIVMMKHKKRK